MKTFLHTLLPVAMVIAAAVGGFAQQRPELVTQTGHTATVQTIAISPDSKYLASAGGDKSIIVWDIQRQKQLYSLKGHTAWVIALAFSPDGALLASGSRDGTVKIWNVFKGIKEEDISLQPYYVTSLAFSPLGGTLAISTTDKMIKLWDVTARKIKPELAGHDGAVTQVVFSHDGKHLASSSLDATLILWDLASGKPKARKTYKEVPSLLFGPGELLNPVEFAIKLRDKQDALTNYIRARFSETTRNLLKTYDGSIPLPDALQNALRNELNKLLQGESLFKESFFTADQLTDEVKQLAARRPQGEDLIRLNRKLLERAYLPEIGDQEKGRGVTSLAYSRDGTFVVCATADNVVSVLNLKTQDLTMLAPPQGYPLLNPDQIVEFRNVFLGMREGREAYPAGSLAFNFNNEVAFVDSHRLRLWDVETKRETLSLEITASGGSRAVTFNKECNLLAFNNGQDVVVVDLLTKGRRVLKGGFAAVDALAFSSNGKWMFSSFGDTSDSWGDTSDVGMLDILSVVSQVSGREVAYVPSEGLLARIKQGVGEGDNNTSEIEVGNPLEPKSPPRLLTGHKKPVISLAAHPKAPILVSCSEDGTVISWDVNTGAPLNILHEDAELIAISPKDGDLLVTASQKRINIWKTETLKKVATISTNINPRTLIFSPDGKTVAALGDGVDGTLNLWNMSGMLLWSVPFNATPKDFKRALDEQSVRSMASTFRHYRTISGPVAFSRDGLLIAGPEMKLARSKLRGIRRG